MNDLQTIENAQHVAPQMGTPISLVPAKEEGRIDLTYVLQLRTNCQAGQFAMGKDFFLGRELELELVYLDQLEGEFFGYPAQSWIRVLAIDLEGQPVSFSLKGESKDNLIRLLYAVMPQKKTSPAKNKVKGIFSQRTSKRLNVGYYAIDWNIGGKATFQPAIQEILASGLDMSQFLPRMM